MAYSVGFTCTRICETQTEGLAECVFAAAPTPVPPDPPPAGCVLVDVRAVALNMPDLLLTVGKFTRVQEPPFALGQEGAGVVIAAGRGCKRLRVGHRVLFGARGGTANDRGPLARTLFR